MTLYLFIKIAQFQIVLSVVNLVVAMIRFGQRSKQTKLLALVFVLGIVGHFTADTLGLRGKDINYPIAIDYMAYICILIVLYNDALNNKYKLFCVITTILFLAFGSANIFLWQKDDINTYTLALGAFIMILFCLLYLYRLLVDLPVKNLHRLPMFWHNAGILIYSSGSFFIFLFVSYLTQVLHNNLLMYWTIHNVFNIVKTLLFFVGLCLDLRSVKFSSSPETAR